MSPRAPPPTARPPPPGPGRAPPAAGQEVDGEAEANLGRFAPGTRPGEMEALVRGLAADLFPEVPAGPAAGPAD